MRTRFRGFDSHSRLHVILDKAGANVEHLVVEGLFYMTKNERAD